jgi:hypothetical protein
MTQADEAFDRKRLPSMLSHTTAIVAMGAVALYAAGVVGSIGRLRASGVDISEGFSLITLERHLRAGIATLFSTTVLLMVPFLTVIGLVLWRSTKKARNATPSSYSRSDRRTLYVTISIAGLLTVLAGIAVPWDIFLVIIVALAIGIAGAYVTFAHAYSNEKSIAVLLVTALALTLGVSAVRNFFASDPLPVATVTVSEHKVIVGPLISVNDGIVYLGSKDRDDFYQSIPTGKIVRFSVERRRRVQEPSVLQILGINFPHERCLNIVHAC